MKTLRMILFIYINGGVVGGIHVDTGKGNALNHLRDVDKMSKLSNNKTCKY